MAGKRAASTSPRMSRRWFHNMASGRTATAVTLTKAVARSACKALGVSASIRVTIERPSDRAASSVARKFVSDAMFEVFRRTATADLREGKPQYLESLGAQLRL